MNAHSLILNIRLNSLQAVFTYRRNKVAAAPEQRLPVVFPELRIAELLSHKSARLRLDDIYKLSGRRIRIGFKKYMNMIAAAVHLQNVQPLLTEYVSDRLVDKLSDLSLKNRLPVFRDEHHMILKQKAAVSVRVIRLILFSSVHGIKSSFHIYIHYNM